MKISMVGYTIPQANIAGASRGIARYIYYLSSELRKMGNDVELFIRDDIRPKEKWINTIWAPKTGWIPYPLFVYMKMRSQTADIFHADYVHTGAPLIWAKKRPAVVAIHDVLPFFYNKKDLTAMDKVRVALYMRNFEAIKKADAIIVGSDDARRKAVEKVGLPEEKVHAVHYGIELDRLKPMKKKPSNKIKIGYLGGLDGRKNVELLVQCFAELSKDNRDIELHLGGTGRNFERFKSMGLPNMFLHGPVSFEDVPKFLNSLDVFVFPTLGEGFGLPVCEAMACGVPVVASNITTMPELVGDAGLLVAPKKEEMKEAIYKMVSSRQLRERLGRAGHKKVQSMTWDSAARKTMRIYEQVLGK